MPTQDCDDSIAEAASAGPPSFIERSPREAVTLRPVSGHSPGRMAQLDSLRGLAVIAVVFFHFGPWRIGQVTDCGHFGVRLFFVLSGFLITGILLDARDRADASGAGGMGVLKAFYARRFLRIFPLYWLVLLICTVIDIRSVRGFLPWHLTYTSNILTALRNDYLPALDHFWSLSVEEQFYIFWPTVVLFLPHRRLVFVIVLTALTGPISRGVLALATGEMLPSIYATPCCLDALGMGGLLACLQRRGDWPALRRGFIPTLLAAGLALYLAWLTMRQLRAVWAMKVVTRDLSYALICTWLVDRASDGFTGPARRLLEWRPLAFVGLISYGIYIWHEVLPLIDQTLWGGCVWRSVLAGERTGLRPFLFVLAASFAVASLSWFLFEGPINRLKSRFPYVNSTGRAD